MLGASLYRALITLSATLPPELREGNNDLAIYRVAGEAMLRGEVPYRDFFIEYPPGSLPALVPPALLSADKPGYIQYFTSEMALVLVATLLLTALAARRGLHAWVLPTLIFVAGALALYPVAVTRYDAVVALTLALATLCAGLGGRYLTVAYASLGFGTAAKLVPVVATLALVRSARGYTVFFTVLALLLAPFLLLGGLVESFTYQAERGLQVESLAASVLIALGWVREITFDFGAFEVQGKGAGLAASLSPPVTIAMLLITVLLMYRTHQRRLRPGVEAFPRYAAALILAFMLGSKVLSPQYLIWLLPLVPLSAGGMSGLAVSTVFLAACWMTTQVYTAHYADLLDLRYPGPQLLLGRNLLLAALWLLMLLLPDRGREKSTP